jgi:PAS domain S-box-containing protein
MGQAAKGNPTPWWLLAIVLATVAVICLGGFRSYTVQRKAVEQEIARELAAVAELKVEQIGAWRRERLADAQSLTSDGELVAAVESIISGRASLRTRQNTLLRLTSFCNAYQYANAIVLDSKGRVVLLYGPTFGAPGHFQALLSEAASQKGAFLRDLHAERGGGYHFGLNIPLRLPGSTQLAGMLSFAITPERYLFPMSSRWAGPGQAGQTFLVRRNGDQALFFAAPAASGDASTRMQLPLRQRDAIAPKALSAGGGPIRGMDLKGRPVVAVVRALPDSQWLVVAQIPLEFLNELLRDRSRPIVLTVFALILAAGMTGAYLWRLQERKYEEARRDAELENRAVLAHYSYLSRSAHDAILLMDQKGRIVEANDRALTMYGFSHEELVGMNAEALEARDAPHRLSECWTESNEDTKALVETIQTRKDGSTFWAEINALKIDIEGTAYHQAIIRDITQRNREKRQLENANRLYAVLSGCSQAIFRAATEQELFDGVCEAAVQEGGFPLAGIVKAELESKDVHPVASAGPSKAYLNEIRLSARLDAFGQGVIGTAFRTGGTAVSEDVGHDSRMAAWHERARKWGLLSLICVPVKRRQEVEFAFVLYSTETSFFNPPEIQLVEEIGAKISYALGRLDEESGRKAAEAALLQSEVRYRLLVESAPLGLYVHRNGLTKYMNPAGLRMLGAASMEAVADKDLMIFIHPDDRRLVAQRILRLHEGEPAPLIEERFVRIDGSVFHVEVSAVPIQFDGEDSILVFFIDATQRKVAEADRARMEEQFLQAQKMESVGRMAGGVAHDFNNNLTVINGYCDLLLSSLSAGDPIRAQLALIRKAGDQAAKLTRQLLTFSHKQAFSPQHVDLNEVVTEAKSLFSRLLGEHIQIVTQLDSSLPCVLADPTQINQVLMNLAINARDAMPEGGKLTIATESVHLRDDQVVRIVGARPGHFVALTISDTGVGMDAETRRHIFEPFFTTKPRGSGTGLGLATVYGIVQQSRGWVEVMSEPGMGTRFRVLLPAVTGAATRNVEPAAHEGSGHGTVLLVEDQDDVRSLTRTILENLGYSVLEAPSGAKALEISAQHQGTIDILVTDVVMPGMSGRALARRLCSLRPSIKVLLVSGYARVDAHEDGNIESEFDLLPKPFTHTALASKMQEVLQRQMGAPGREGR